jgi:hypothetical protein
MRGQYEAGAVAQSVLNGSQRLANAGIVGDAAGRQGNVEIHAHENSPIVERKIPNRKLGHMSGTSLRDAARISVLRHDADSFGIREPQK